MELPHSSTKTARKETQIHQAWRVLLTLFQQSYKGFKKKFLKICCIVHDPTLVDGFPLYWVEKPGVKKPRSLEDLAAPDLKRYIGTFPYSVSFLLRVACL